MNRTLQLKAILLFLIFLSFGRATINAQCIFYNQTERLQYAAIKAIYDQNSKVFFSLNLKNFVKQQICSICDIPEVYCEREKVVGLSFRGSNLTTIPREIAAFPDLQFLYLDNNQLSCLPKEVAVVCAGNAANLTLEGNPIFNTTGFFDFCANPRDICIPSFSFPTCDQLGFINYLDTLYILGLGDKYNKVEIIGANTGWKVFPVCENCDDLQLINDLPNGDYTLKINLTDKNGQSCYREEKITIARNGVQPLPPATTIGAINCDQLEFDISQGDVYINGLTANYNKVEYIGANTNWKVMLECDGTCSTNTLIPSLKVGTYTIKIFQSDGLGNTCYREKIVTIDNLDPTLPNDGELGSINCDGLEFEITGRDVYINGLTAVYNKVEYIGANTDWKVIRECDGDCPSIRLVQGLKQGTYTFKIFQSGEFGENCYHEETVRIDSGDLPYPSEQNGQLNCGNLVFDGFVNQIYVGNLMASYNKVEYIGAGTNWKVKTLCDGNCSTAEYSPDLPLGNYTVKVNQKDEQTQFVNRSRVGGHGAYCYTEARVNILGSGNRNSSLNFQEDLVLFPNPARDQLQLTRSDLEGKVKINIYNTLGHLVKSIPEIKANDESVAIDLNGFENGMYWLSLSIANKPPINKRFIVEHLR